MSSNRRIKRHHNLIFFDRFQHVESMGGKLELVAKFPDRPPVVIDHIGVN